MVRVVNAFSTVDRNFGGKNSFSETKASFTVDIASAAASTTYDANTATIYWEDPVTSEQYFFENAAFTTGSSGDSANVEFTAVDSGPVPNDDNNGGVISAGTTDWTPVSGDWAGSTLENITFTNTSAITGGLRGTGGWNIYSGNISDIISVFGDSPYATYVPQSTDLRQLSLIVKSGGTSDIVLQSPYVSVREGVNVGGSIAAIPINTGLDISIDLKFYAAPGGAPITNGSSPVSRTVNEDVLRIMSQYVKVPSGARFAQMELVVSGYDSTNLADGNIVSFYDPVIAEVSLGLIAEFSKSVYSILPEFMLLDDDNINDILGKSSAEGGSSRQNPRPLQRFVESLCASADQVTEVLRSFRYNRATSGSLFKSKLTDPATAEASYLRWLASVTGSDLIVGTSGVSPWAALEAFEGEPVLGDPGEWEDIESLDDWLALQNIDPDFFDVVESFRDQLSLGFAGLNAGRADTITAFIRTLLQSSSPEDDVVVVKNDAYDNPFMVDVLVDPNVDPDPTGTLVEDSVNQGLSAGTVAFKKSNVTDASRMTYDFSTILQPATESADDASGVVVYGKSFVSDESHYGRHIALNGGYGAASFVPDLGGGVGNAHYSLGNAYYYGDVSSSVVGSLSSDKVAVADSLVNFGGAGSYDIVAVLTDVTAPVAPVYSGSASGTPDPLFMREKRLIVCGTDSGSDNDWALYLASGFTASEDTEFRLLLVDGYRDENSSNYAVSDPIDSGVLTETGDLCVRVSLDSGQCEFFAQSSLYDDWADNSLGVRSITPSSAASSGDSGVQVLGELSNGLWSDASPLSCSVKRVLLFDAPISFSGESSLSASTHAVVNGYSVNNFATFEYIPTVDIDLSDVPVYADSFAATTLSDNQIGSLTITVNQAASNNLDVLAMRPHPNNAVVPENQALWYFGDVSPKDSSLGDSLVVSGLPADTYDWVVSKVTPSTGAVSTTSDITSAGATSITFDADIYGGQTIRSIEVTPNSGGEPVALFEAYVSGSPTLSSIDSGTVTSGTDSKGATWTLTRSWHSGLYSPSQPIDKPALHAYEGSPTILNSPSIEHWSSFSLFLHIRRFWTGTEGVDTHDIFKMQNSAGQGLHVYYDGPKLKADFSDGTNTDSVEWEESPDYGDWHRIVVRRNGDRLGLVVDGDVANEVVDTNSIVVPFSERTSLATLSEGDAGTYNARFSLANIAFFLRDMDNNEIILLESQQI